MHDIRVPDRLRVSAPKMLLRRLEPAGVGLERGVHRREIPVPQRVTLQLAGDQISPLAIRAVRIRDIPRGLFEIGHQPTSLDDLREDVRHALAGDVGATELRHRVVAVLAQDPLVQPFGAFYAHALRSPAARYGVQELVEKQTSDRLGRPRVPGEQRALHHLWQIPEREDRLVEVGEIGRQGAALIGGELLCNVSGI